MIARAKAATTKAGGNNTVVLVDNRNEVLRRIQEQLQMESNSDNIIDAEIIKDESKK